VSPPRWILVGALSVVIAGCASSGAHVAAPIASTLETPSPTASPTPSPTPSPKPSPSPRHTAKPTPKPTRQTTVATNTHATYVFPVQCHVTYAHSHHDYPATDIMAARGCAVVAVTNGRVDEVSYTDTWSSKKNDGATRGGLSISIVGDDGVRYYGSHLETIANGIAPGVHVRAGQVIGRVGDSGDARGGPTHLHFGVSWPTDRDVWWVRRGMVYPWPYLDSWRAGGNKSPAAAVASLHAKDGDEPPCHVDC
jgi:murein DD-endopeptidase MepM/ murein hydrolase activator NlpD